MSGPGPQPGCLELGRGGHCKWGSKENRPEKTEPAPGDPQKAWAGSGQLGDRWRQPLQDSPDLPGTILSGVGGNKMRPRLSRASGS